MHLNVYCIVYSTIKSFKSKAFIKEKKAKESKDNDVMIVCENVYFPTCKSIHNFAL